ncbi:hypothetical protein TNIN_128891 [Trichonephila inaurata madagascariensis]|uniref:Uncharacterized protein n=1 Tax=Trichonephila inaurata madagascariensis TaxID=2747483 RepID=A0A8X7CPB0_9ARAC|nr:hypothetical protein TNIN_128891 [Trichonephila inaurata madagascariensis]
MNAGKIPYRNWQLTDDLYGRFPPGVSHPTTTGKKLERYKNNVCYDLLSNSKVKLLIAGWEGRKGVYVETEMAQTTKMSHSWDDKVRLRAINKPSDECT